MKDILGKQKYIKNRNNKDLLKVNLSS